MKKNTNFINCNLITSVRVSFLLKMHIIIPTRMQHHLLIYINIHIRGYKDYTLNSNPHLITSGEDMRLSMNKGDRLDGYLQSIDPALLVKYKNEDGRPIPLRIREHVFGLKSYLFSEKCRFNFTIDKFEENKHLVIEAVESFLCDLAENTVYKCMLVGITDEGDLKSHADGTFFITRHTRVEYLVMKIKNSIKESSNKYVELDFLNWVLSYKVWLRTDTIERRIQEALKILEDMHKRELEKDAKIRGEANPLDRTRDYQHYHRWLMLGGSIGKCLNMGGYNGSIVKQTKLDIGFKVEVEVIENAETVSWVDRWVNENSGQWVRMFSDGTDLYYNFNEYMYSDMSYRTEFWQSERKEYEYDHKFGSADFETYTAPGAGGDGRQIAYAAGFMDYKKVLKMFYRQEGDGEYDVVIRMIEELLVERHNGSTFYIHNLARFDSRFILPALGQMKGVNVWLWGRDMNEIFKIRASKKIGKKSVNIVFLDSFYQLPMKLDTLGKKFNTATKKGIFPYKFVNKDNLFYKGDVPAIGFFEGQIGEGAYNDLSNESAVWDVKEQTLKYLRADLECLFQIMHSYNRTIFDDFLVNAVKLSSYSALSKKVYVTNFYEKTGVKVPIISGHLESWIRRAYKGGVVDVIQHLVANAIKYDSNSHYPAAMLNAMPVGTPRITSSKDLNEIFGFCYAEITAPSKERLLCPILPTWDADGSLHCPRGVWRDTYFSEELKNAVHHGYRVKVLSAVRFDKGEGLFDEFIKEMYKRKAEAKEAGDGVEELLYKLLQNSLFGKAGQKEIIHSFKLIDSDKLKSFELKNKTDLVQSFGDKCLVRTQGKIEGELEGIVNKFKPTQESLYDEDVAEKDDIAPPRDIPVPPRKKHGVKSSVSIAAAITAYARISMNRYKNIKDNKYLGGDTDSAIMEKELEPKFIGKELGLMKVESRVKLGLFADKKLYLMVDDDNGEIVIKSRGVGREARGTDILTYYDFLKLFNADVVEITKNKFIIKKDGIYIVPQTIRVKIGQKAIVNIKEELNNITNNIKHPLYILARQILATAHTSLIINHPILLALTLPTCDFILVNYSVVSWRARIVSLILFILYTAGGINVNATEFNNRIYYGLMRRALSLSPLTSLIEAYRQRCRMIYNGWNNHILYVDNSGLALNYIQFYTGIHRGVIPYIIYISHNSLALNYWQYHTKVYIGLVIWLDILTNNKKEDRLDDVESLLYTKNGTKSVNYSRGGKIAQRHFGYCSKKLRAIMKRIESIDRKFKALEDAIEIDKIRLLCEKRRALKEPEKSITKKEGITSTTTGKKRSSSHILGGAVHANKSFKGSIRKHHTLSAAAKRDWRGSAGGPWAFRSKAVCFHLGGLQSRFMSRLFYFDEDLKNEPISSLRDWERFAVLNVFKRNSENLLSPIYLTKSLLYSIDRSDKCLAKLPSDSLVKRFILNSLQNPFKITAELDGDGINILNNVRGREPFIRQKIPLAGSGEHVLYCTDVRYTPIAFISFNTSIFRLEKIYGGLETKFNDKHNTAKFNCYYQSSEYLFDDTLSGCYIVYSKKTLYYYIGYSNVISNRLKTHYRKMKSLNSTFLQPLIIRGSSDESRDASSETANTYLLNRSSALGGEGGWWSAGCKSDLWKFYIDSCYKNKVDFDIEMGPLCLYPNYLKTFQQKYPDYKASVGENLILTFYSDLVGMILEQSLIYFYNPLLNSLQKIGVKNLTWDDKYLNIAYTKGYKHKNMKYLIRHRGGIVSSPKSELYLIQKYNLDIDEVLANLNKWHIYKNAAMLAHPVLISLVED